MTSFLRFLTLALVFLSSSIALAADEPPAEVVAAVEKLADGIFSAGWWGSILAGIGSLYVVLWGIGEGLTRISVLTENKWDNKVAAWFSAATWWIGSVAGALGVKLPKLVILEEAKKIEAAEQAKKEKKAAKAAAAPKGKA